LRQKRPLPLGEVRRLIEPESVVPRSAAVERRPNAMAISWQTTMEFEPPRR
jgi:flavin reductase (DIM6/NTAB) family NADH-FMN oxidoreductase RutF